ncbi:hypothetical protein CEY11_14345 [Candidimonas nitroreducens]|uniref:Uncharacterized protein n=1 Tax=Candidimonas nitroreducens TaxID=683354 RepID=A0A225MF22_9BURK|nr:hypothetical protein CEY11_14345 [Candidimonas nitroreducens]
MPGRILSEDVTRSRRPSRSFERRGADRFPVLCGKGLRPLIRSRAGRARKPVRGARRGAFQA